MKSKIFSLFSLLLVGASLLACASEVPQKPEETDRHTDPASDVPTETEDPYPKDMLPEDLNFGGAEFRSVAFTWQGYNCYFYADAESGDIMNDALYHRKRAVEERLNVKVINELIDSVDTRVVPEAVRKAVDANEDLYQQALLHCITQTATLSMGGYLYDLVDMPNLNLGADWWNQEQMEKLELGRSRFFAINDFMIPCPYIVYFNKTMCQNQDFESPYQLVYDGKWTLDRMTEMARTVSSDMNGDGVRTYTDDSYGISAPETSKYESFLVGAGQFSSEKDETGSRTLIINSEKTDTIVELFRSLKNDNILYLPQVSEYGDEQITMNSGRLLFQLDTLVNAEKMRDYTVDFGFLPYPKYDEAQEEYYSLDWGGLMCVPSSIRDPEMVGSVIEYFAYESGREVIPTYYQMVLTGKLSRDQDAEKMLDLIFDTICYDPIRNFFGDQSYMNPIGYVAFELTSSYASYFAKIERGTNKTISHFYDSFIE